MCKKLEVARVVVDMTQQGLAEKAKVSRTMIWKIENHGPDGVLFGNLKKIARALGKTVAELFLEEV